jgi:hypothetical protein
MSIVNAHKSTKVVFNLNNSKLLEKKNLAYYNLLHKYINV